MNIDQYLEMAIKYKVGLGISSLAELCYRDIEYMAVGIPMIRLEYVTKTNPPLIPNFHYIAVDRKNIIYQVQKIIQIGEPIWMFKVEMFMYKRIKKDF